MSAHEFMNMARVRAEQAEARAAKAEAEVERIRGAVARYVMRPRAPEVEPVTDERDDPAGFDVAAFYEMKERAEKAEAAITNVQATLRSAAHEAPHGASGAATRFLLWQDLSRHGYEDPS